ncbi:hypothetical protein SynA1524_01932 [Synechococcus sp. A15-24]|nr:hypothetical protein SynA1524_01932 [Synechococcus sp. A15-24]
MSDFMGHTESARFQKRHFQPCGFHSKKLAKRKVTLLV